MSVDERSAASLVSSSAPDRVNHALPIAENTGISVGTIIGRVSRRQPKRLDMAVCKTNSEKRFGRVQGGSEDVGVDREGACIFEHFGQGTGSLRCRCAKSVGAKKEPERTISSAAY